MTTIGPLHYRRAGKGPALVLVHGFLGGSAIWDAQIVQFAASHDVIAPDLAGFGASAALEAPDSIEAKAQAVIALLRSLGIERFDLVGHSMGGMVAQGIAAAWPEAVARLVLYGTSPSGSLGGRFETIAESQRRLQEDGPRRTAERIAATWFVDGTAAPDHAACAELGARMSVRSGLNSMSAWEKWNGIGELAKLRMPTLVLWGDKDRSIGWKEVETLWRGIDGALLAVVPGSAHAVHLEHPDLFHRLVAPFLSRSS